MFWKRVSIVVALLCSSALVTGVPAHAVGLNAQQASAQESGTASTDAPGVLVRAAPLSPGSPFTAFTVVEPAGFSGTVTVTIRPSDAELALAGDDPANLQVVSLLSNASIPCSLVQAQLQCTVDQPGRYSLAVNTEVDGSRGPPPIRIDPGATAGVVSVGPPSGLEDGP